MSSSEEDIRTVLNAPIPVITDIGTLHVTEMTAMETIMWADEISAVIALVRKEARKINATDPDYLGAIGVVCRKYPLSIIPLLSGKTGRTPDDLGGLRIEQYLDVVDAFFEKHEAAIVRFFGLRDRFTRLMATGNRPSPKSSMPSSPEVGVSTTSENSHSDNSKSSPENAPPEDTKINSTS